jgi:hypothetical protein
MQRKIQRANYVFRQAPATAPNTQNDVKNVPSLGGAINERMFLRSAMGKLERPEDAPAPQKLDEAMLVEGFIRSLR